MFCCSKYENIWKAYLGNLIQNIDKNGGKNAEKWDFSQILYHFLCFEKKKDK